MSRPAKIGLIAAGTYLILFGLVWTAGTLEIGCSGTGCFAYHILAQLLLSFPGIFIFLPMFLANIAVLVVLNSIAIFLAGYFLTRSRLKKSDTQNFLKN